MIVYFQEGNTQKKGQVVFMAIPFKEMEPHVVVEVETQSDGHSQRWNGKFEGHHMYTPREGVSTYCIPATAVIPEHLMEGSVHEVIQKPEEGVVQEQCTNFSRARNKGKKSSEPFFLANNRDKPRKTPSPYGSNEKLDKGGRKTVGRRDLSDHYCPPLGNKTEMRPDRTEELDLISDHYGPGAADCLEDDVVQEVLDTVSKDWEKIAHSLYLSNDEIYGIASKRGTSRDRAEEMLRVWQKRKIGYDKISRLAAACRANGFIKLADDLEQGLDEDMLMKIASNIPTHKARPLGTFLNFSDAELERIEDKASDTVPFVRLMLAQWRTRQSHNSDKIMLLSNALHYCGLRQLELEVARGLDDEIMLSFAVQIGHSWKILATTLRLDLKDIHNLECFSQDKQPYQMLMLWRRKQPRSVDVLGALSKGLRESGLPDLASDLVQGVDDEMLYKLATLIGDVWDVVALHLGFSEEEIKELSDTKGSEVISIINMLNKWRERHDYTKDRFMFLMEALRASGLGQVAESFEEDKHKVELSRKNAASAKTEEYPEYPNDKGHPVLYVNRDVLVRVSKKVNFAQLCKVLDIPSEEEVEIEMYYLTNEQRVFQLLDCWKRRGDGGERSIEELLQVLAHVGGHSALIDDIMKAVEAAEEKVEDSQMKQLPPDTSIAFPSFHTEEPPEEIDPDLDVNSMVEVKPSDKTHYGVIRWIGVPMGSKTNRKIAGIELESPISQGATDGTFNKQRYFKCEPRKAIFVYLSQCKHDSRFPTMAQTFSSAKRQTSEDFGGYSSPVVEGFVDPPPRLESAFLGMPKGIQGDQNSCYLDSTLFSMFAYNSVFDPLLRRTQGQDDLQEYEKVQKTLRESIVNPLRKNGFVRADRILELREHLDHLGTTKGLMNEEKDPEEFLHTLLSEVFKSRPQLKIRHGGNKEIDESNIYQIFLDRDESFTLPTVEQLLLQSFQEHDLKLVEVPSCLIVQMPRFGKEYKMYNRILPSLQLNITDIIEGYPRQCIVCGNLAVFECNSCKSEEAFVEASHIKNYCKNCFEMMHVGTKRERHQPTQLEVPDEFMRSFYSKTMEKGYTDEQVDAHRQKMLTLKLMDLFAVICIRTSHYVAFVKAGREKDSEWVFFDSMADRQGDQPGYNIPQISHLKDFRDWVNVDKLKRRIESKQLTELMNRLLGDAYICMYSNSEQSDQTYV
ncbi:uncharacterized protein LOC110974701 isoform X2 [Acanthaster planci]|uniref:ubiquitinyl hydrolase 1 n=1 Tax=Acanthaster planci TaxID=133434 RepID=A0A8B7XMY6_ACAPL|nr:uncharacterized protein LOC110974701 isoform X2 [Acanthaster planci]